MYIVQQEYITKINLLDQLESIHHNWLIPCQCYALDNKADRLLRTRTVAGYSRPSLLTYKASGEVGLLAFHWYLHTARMQIHGVSGLDVGT